MKKHLINIIGWLLFQTVQVNFRPIFFIHLMISLIITGRCGWIGILYLAGSLTTALYSQISMSTAVYIVLVIFAPIIGLPFLIGTIIVIAFCAIYLGVIVVFERFGIDSIDLEDRIRKHLSRN